MELSDRGVFLTGGAQGIGLSVTAALLEKGAKVLFCDINAEVGKATEDKLQKKYGADNVSFVECDVTDADQLQAAFDAAVKKFGAVEICANNAGIVDQRIWEKMIAINMTAQIRGSEIAFEHMRRDKGGRGGVIINTSSTAGVIRYAETSAAYVATKHGIVGYTTSRAADPDMPALGVRWCCLCPSAVNTRMLNVEEGQVKNAQKVRKLLEGNTMEPEVLAKAFIKQLEDVKNNGKIMVVDKDKGAVYHKRLLLAEDGVSEPLEVDSPLPEHPPVPGHNLQAAVME